MRRFHAEMRVAPGSRILDIGGTADLWRNDPVRARVTLLNLPHMVAQWPDDVREQFPVIAGDICRAADLPAGYDIAFSNSVLEHVGSRRRQQQFADAIARAGAYWVQVPAPAFPFEVHCRVPFWWALPAPVRRALIRRWKRQGHAFIARQMSGTRPISRRRLQSLFPDGRIETERWLGFPKSYYVYRPVA